MTPRQLDALVAEKVMGRSLRKPGEKYVQCKFYYFTQSGLLKLDNGFPNVDPTFHPSEDADAAYDVERRIEKMGAESMSAYGAALVALLWDDPPSMNGMFHFGGLGVFSIANASPEKRCLAALKAVGGLP